MNGDGTSEGGDTGSALEPLETVLPQTVTEWESVARLIREATEKIRNEFGEAPPKYVFRRKGAAGEDWDYVREDFFEEALDKHCPDWSYGKPEILLVGPEQGFPKPCVLVSNCLSFTIAGVRRTVGAVGEKQVEFTTQKTDRLDQEGKVVHLIATVPGAAKSADTDCFKRCCVRALRLAWNIYRKKDADHYAMFNLSETDIGILKDWQPTLERAVEHATGTAKDQLEGCLKLVSEALSNPEDADRQVVFNSLDKSAEVINAIARG